MNNGSVEFVDFEGGEALVNPTGEGGGPRQFKEPSVATVTLVTRRWTMMIDC